MEIRSNQARLSSTCIRGKTLHFWSPSYLNEQNYIVYWTDDNDLCLSLSTRSIIPTFSLTLTVCYELLAPCQSLQLTTSEQTVLWSLSKDIYVPPWQRKECQAWLWWIFTTKSPLTVRCCGSAFCGKIRLRRMLLLDPVFDETQNWNKVKCSIFSS